MATPAKRGGGLYAAQQLGFFRRKFLLRHATNLVVQRVINGDLPVQINRQPMRLGKPGATHAIPGFSEIKGEVRLAGSLWSAPVAGARREFAISHGCEAGQLHKLDK
jgi:hypothetical protein